MPQEERTQAKEMHKLAVRLNKNVLGYMGDRQLQYPAMLARELIKAGYESAEVRIYRRGGASKMSMGIYLSSAEPALPSHSCFSLFISLACRVVLGNAGGANGGKPHGMLDCRFGTSSTARS